MKRIIIPAAMLCALLCVWLGNQPDRGAAPTPVPTMMQIETTVAPMTEIEVPELKTEVSAVEAVMPTPLPVPVPMPVPAETLAPTPIPTPPPTPVPTTPQPVQAGDMVYVEGFGWLESQGEGTVIYDENMYENGNKVGCMG